MLAPPCAAGKPPEAPACAAGKPPEAPPCAAGKPPEAPPPAPKAGWLGAAGEEVAPPKLNVPVLKLWAGEAVPNGEVAVGAPNVGVAVLAVVVAGVPNPCPVVAPKAGVAGETAPAAPNVGGEAAPAAPKLGVGWDAAGAPKDGAAGEVAPKLKGEVGLTVAAAAPKDGALGVAEKLKGLAEALGAAVLAPNWNAGVALVVVGTEAAVVVVVVGKAKAEDGVVVVLVVKENAGGLAASPNPPAGFAPKVKGEVPAVVVEVAVAVVVVGMPKENSDGVAAVVDAGAVVAAGCDAPNWKGEVALCGAVAVLKLNPELGVPEAVVVVAG